MQNKPYNFRPVPTINYARLKFTLILLMLLFAGKYVKADVPCYQAIQMQHDSIDSLETRLATAQSLPYNIGYQEGYKVATLQHNKDKWEPIIVLAVITILVGLSSLIVPKHWTL